MNYKALLNSKFSSITNATVITLLCISCSARIPQSTIYFIDTNTDQTKLWPVVTDETDEYIVEVEPKGNVGDNLIFQVDMTNKALDTLFINTREWELAYADSLGAYDVLDMQVLNSMSPDEVSLAYSELGNRIQQAENAEKAAAAIFFIVLVVGVFFIIAAAADDDAECEDEEYDLGFVSDITFESGGESGNSNYVERSPQQQIEYYFQMSKEVLNDKQEMFLLKGEHQVFDLYFPRRDDMKTLKLKGVVNGQFHEWNFLHYFGE